MKPQEKAILIALMTIILGLTVLAGCSGSGAGSADPDNPSAESTMDDRTLAAYACTANIAINPGSLAYLPIGTAGSPQTRGYVEYVPKDYAKKTSWPCIINLHGDGELGDGTTVEKLQVFNYSSLPGMIYQDSWDAKRRFIVLSPQFVSYDDRSADNVRDFVRFAKANYRIDPARIYFTSVSGGGVALARYLNKYGDEDAAAILPVSCYISPASPIIWKDVPIWFLCGAADMTVKPDNIVSNYNALVKAKAAITPRITLYTGVGHDGNSCNKSYSPATMDNTVETEYAGITLTPYSNVYDWLLQYRKK